jgi:hypothetical protein
MSQMVAGAGLFGKTDWDSDQKIKFTGSAEVWEPLPTFQWRNLQLDHSMNQSELCHQGIKGTYLPENLGYRTRNQANPL